MNKTEQLNEKQGLRVSKINLRTDMKKEIEELSKKAYPINPVKVSETLTIDSNKLARDGFIAGYQKALEERPSEFPAFVNSTELSQKDKDLIKGVYYDFLSFPNTKENS